MKKIKELVSKILLFNKAMIGLLLFGILTLALILIFYTRPTLGDVEWVNYIFYIHVIMVALSFLYLFDLIKKAIKDNLEKKPWIIHFVLWALNAGLAIANFIIIFMNSW